MVKASCYDENGLKKGAWSEDEDNKLKAYIQRYGHWNWGLLPKFAGVSRSGKSCRLRWMNYLRPNMKHGNFSKQEDAVIIELHNKLGNKWSAIATKLPGRSDNEIKNRWNTHLKKRVQSNRIVSKNQHVGTLEPDKANPKVNLVPQTYGSSHLASRTLDHETIIQQTYGSSHLAPQTLDDETVSQQTYGSSHHEPQTPQTLNDETFGDFWTEPFLTDNDYIIPSGNNLLSSFNFVNDFIWQSSCEDNTMMTQEFLLSTLDTYVEANNMEFIRK